MAHYALLDNSNKVVQVIVGANETEVVNGISNWEAYYADVYGLRCVRTSYNHNIRKQYAGIGYTYDADADVFISPQPYPSWTLDTHHDWQPPTEMPTDGKMYAWNEDDQEWVLVVAG